MGPMASAFNLCAVAGSWSLVLFPYTTQADGYALNDPGWTVALNAVSLAIAILANFALLAHMTGRLCFNYAIPAVIVGWYFSGFTNIALAATADLYAPLPDTKLATRSQSYYYAIFAGGIYVFLAALLSVTAYGVWIRHYSNEVKLSLSQRFLMLHTGLFLCYVLAAAAVFSNIEQWMYLDGVYYVIVTVFTIGFGDVAPITHLGRSLYFPFAAGGILFVGLIVANIRNLVVESASKKISFRTIEKARYKAIHSGRPENKEARLCGIIPRDLNGNTELERRSKEFHVMRDVQTQAARQNLLFGLGMSILAFMILWFVGAVAFWKAEQSEGE
jgi:potassium channel subfamily K